MTAPITRRGFLQGASAGFGWLAFSALFGNAAPMFKASAKNVIFCFMDGGPSHVDTFDPKPMLTKQQGKPIGAGAVSRLSQSSAGRVWLGSPWEFKRRGQSGLWVSELFPNIARVADRIAVVRNMIGEQPLHGQQNLLLHTGRIIGRAPSLGAWVSYGLGTENENLPGFVCLNNDWVPNGGLENFGSAYLPARHQATMVRAKGAPMDNIVPADAPEVQRRKLALLAAQDNAFAKQSSDAAAIDGAIANYETAFRMQSLLPIVAETKNEPKHIR